MERPVPNLPGDEAEAQKRNKGHDRAGSRVDPLVLDGCNVRNGRACGQFRSGMYSERGSVLSATFDASPVSVSTIA